MTVETLSPRISWQKGLFDDVYDKVIAVMYRDPNGKYVEVTPLISAAPELLALLIRCIPLVSGYEGARDFHDEIDAVLNKVKES